MRLLVFGGREFGNPRIPGKNLDLARKEYRFVLESLDVVHKVLGVTLVISGKAPGADSVGEDWANKRGIEVLPFPADWKRLGRAAGASRNERMLVEGMPDAAIGFPGGPGTADMTRRLIRAGVDCWKITPPWMAVA